MNQIREAYGGLLPKDNPRPPKFAFAVSLYRTNLLFRGLIDLAVIGFIVLLFTADWSSPATVERQIASMTADHEAPRTVTPRQTSTPSKGAIGNIGIGWPTADAMEVWRIDDTIADAPIKVRSSLVVMAGELEGGNPDRAWEIFETLDHDDPYVAYAGAVLTFRTRPASHVLEVQKLLRTAADHTLPVAYSLLGDLHYLSALLTEMGRVPPGEPVILDGAGNPVEASRQELLELAAEWWRRGAAFDQARSKRGLGMLAARGDLGRPDYAAAFAFWQDGADLGDPVSTTELALLYLLGAGIAPDQQKAVSLLRSDAARHYAPANLLLAVSLAAMIKAGDADATREAFDALDRVVASTLPPGLRGFAQHTYGLFLMDTAPAALRDPVAAVGHWREAAVLGNAAGTFALARAYHLGIGADRNGIRAYALLASLPDRYARIADPMRAEIEPDLTPGEVEKAKILSRLPAGKILDLTRDASSPDEPLAAVGAAVSGAPGPLREVSPNTTRPFDWLVRTLKGKE